MKSSLKFNDDLGNALKTQIEKAFKGKNTVERIADYDKNFYIFIAKPKGNSKAVLNTTYALNKKDGNIVNFTPSGDFSKFFDAMENKVIYPDE